MSPATRRRSEGCCGAPSVEGFLLGGLVDGGHCFGFVAFQFGGYFAGFDAPRDLAGWEFGKHGKGSRRRWQTWWRRYRPALGRLLRSYRVDLARPTSHDFHQV